MNSEIRPVVFMLFSTLSLSVTGLLAKFLSTSFDASWLCFFRLFVPALMIFWLMMITEWSMPEKGNWKALIIRGFCIAGSQLCFLVAIKELTLVESVVLFSTSPLFVPLLERIFLKVKVKPLIIFNLILTFIGVLFMAGHIGNMKMGMSILIGLGGGVFNAGSQLSMYYSSSKTKLTPLGVGAWSFIIASALMIPLLIVSPVQASTEWHLLTGWQHPILLLVLFLAVCTVNTQIFRSKAYKLAESGSQLAPIIFTNLIFSMIWQVAFFDQPMSGTKIIGVALIVFATLLNTFVPIWIRKKQKQ